MARSRATSGTPLVARRVLLLGGEGAHLALELVDPVVEARGVAVAHVEDQRAADAQGDGDQEEHEAVHASPTSTTSWAQRPQSSPPSQVSRFQIGTVALSVSMQNR